MLVAVAVIALALLVVGGAHWRKRRARGVPAGDRTAGPIAAEVALAPAPVPVRASRRGGNPDPRPSARPGQAEGGGPQRSDRPGRPPQPR